jgi:hypothetical protein
MAEKLSKKLNPAAQSAAPEPPAGEAAGGTEVPEKILCLVVNENDSFACEFQVETGATWVFPFFHFKKAEGIRTGRELTIYFATDTVRLKGRHLKHIKDVLMRSRNFTVRALGEEHSKNFTGDEVFVSSLQVEAVSDDATEGADE